LPLLVSDMGMSLMWMAGRCCDDLQLILFATLLVSRWTWRCAALPLPRSDNQHA
jgi:hypothetical protein